MSLIPILLADAARLAIGWALFAVGVLLAGALVGFPAKRKNPMPDDHA